MEFSKEDKSELTVESLANAVVDNVRKALLVSLPDESIAALIEKEFEAFFRPRQVKESYSNKYITKPSKFSEMVNTALDELIKETVKDDLSRNFQGWWNSPEGELLYNNFTEEQVKKVAPAALEGIMGAISSQVMKNMVEVAQRGY